MSRKLAIPLLGVMLWVLSLHAGSFATASLLFAGHPGIGKPAFYYTLQERDARYAYPSDYSPMEISESDLNQSVTNAEVFLGFSARVEESLVWSNIRVLKDTPSHGQLIANLPNPEALAQGRDAIVAAKASYQLLYSQCKQWKTRENCIRDLTQYKMTSTPLGASCAAQDKICSDEEIQSKYRSMDGSCNHISSGKQGQSFTPYSRLLFSDYMDEISSFRHSVIGGELPSARLITTKVTHNVDQPDSHLTLAYMQWSQFIEHDLSHTVTSKMVFTKSSIECCESWGNNLAPRYRHEFCERIPVPETDKFYHKFWVRCLPYVRSLPAIRADCTFGPIDQMNQATHFLDGSHIYGTTPEQTESLREKRSGRLLTSESSGRQFLPVSDDPQEECQLSSTDTVCYRAGDGRVNVHPQLTAMHTVWLREHNRLADALLELNPHWDDETLFQEARRILIAELQHITYWHWLPLTLGGSAYGMSQTTQELQTQDAPSTEGDNELCPPDGRSELITMEISLVKPEDGKRYTQKLSHSDGFREDIDPSVSNSVATAALRFINSLMESRLKLYNEDRISNLTLRLREHFNNPTTVEKPGHFDALLRGLATQHSQRLDMGFVTDVTQHLYANGKDFGYDAISFDIQRGRDHGLPGYIHFRELCGLPSVNTFEDLLNVMPVKAVSNLRSVYRHPADVDLIIGGMLETSDTGSLLGPTFSCLIADQMYRTRSGDRYFYSSRSQPEPFTKAQLQEIEKVTLSRVFCDNSDDIVKMQPDIFQVISQRNNLVRCDSDEIPRLDLEPWREVPSRSRLTIS